MTIVLTGAGGFLGWHTRLRLHAYGGPRVVPLERHTWPALPKAVQNAEIVIHIAGVNRAQSDDDIRRGNVQLARDLAAAMDSRPGLRVIYANSIQSGNGSPYGDGKQQALDVLSAAADRTGGSVIDVRLPNIFGEHGRPQYNSFVATFVDACIRGQVPTIKPNTVRLMHAQDAAEVLISAIRGEGTQVTPDAEEYRVEDVWQLLQEFHSSYAYGELPDLRTKFRVDLFNTYRAAMFPDYYPLLLTPYADARGSFVETVRARGGGGQSSMSTTLPGATRGEHYHLRKVERFAVVQGAATIRLRRMFTDRIVEFSVDGTAPTAIDMPTGWVHNITNTGTGALVTQFWSNDLFRVDEPDTYHEPVEAGRQKNEVLP